jgi:two-component system phosphate regulon sensor histidine kinase PhoR
MKTKRKLIWHIYPSYLLIIVAALVAVGVYISTTLERFYVQETQHQLEVHAYLFRMLFEEQFTFDFRIFDKFSMDFNADESKKIVSDVDSLCKTVGKYLAARVTVILASGVVIGDSMENPATMDNHADRPEVRMALSEQIGTSRRYSYTVEKDMLYIAIPVKSGDHILGVVRVSAPVTAIQHTLNRIYKKIALGGIVAALIAAIISFLMSYRINTPLEEMKQGALRFANGNLTHKLHIEGSQEITLLAETMNQMASQLHERIETVTEQRNELETMLSSMVEAVVVIDSEGRIVRCNQAAGRLFRFTPEAVKNRNIREVIRNADVHRFVKTTLTSDTPIEAVVVMNSGNEQFLRAHGTLLRTATRQTTGALLVFHDITRLKQLENIRRDFVANVSHELKTPITSIKGFVETLRDGAINDLENALKFLDIIARNANRLNAIIEDLLSLSKIEQEEEKGQLPLLRENIKDVLQTAVMVCESKAQDKNITVNLHCPDQLDAQINAELIEQAVVNLLDNAIKYSEPQSTINVSAEQRDEEVVVMVQDFGCGIPNVHLPRLFERFYRVDKARSRNLGGTGLGLAIVKHIVNAHHGRIVVESTPGKGSTFSLVLPP